MIPPAILRAVELALLATLGIGSGVLVGAAFVALLTALGVPSRLVALTGTRRCNAAYALAVAGGALAGAFWLPFPYTLSLPGVLAAVPGLLTGIFVGMLASALAETIGVVPVLSRRVGLGSLVGKVVWAVAAGKIIGSLAYWTFPPFTAP